MRRLLLFLCDSVLLVCLPFLMNNLAGYPRTPSSNDDNLLTTAKLKQLSPDLDDGTLSKFATAVDHHLKGEFTEAIQSYEQAQSAQLHSGKKIDLFEDVPAAKVNYDLAKAHRRSLLPGNLPG